MHMRRMIEDGGLQYMIVYDCALGACHVPQERAGAALKKTRERKNYPGKKLIQACS